MSTHRRTSLELNNNLPEEDKENKTENLISETSIKKKGGLKPESQRQFSHKKIDG